MTATWSRIRRARDRYRLGSKEICLGAAPKSTEDFCRRRCAICWSRSDNLYRRIARLDDVLFGGDRDYRAGRASHWNRLEQVFGGE